MFAVSDVVIVLLSCVIFLFLVFCLCSGYELLIRFVLIWFCLVVGILYTKDLILLMLN